MVATWSSATDEADWIAEQLHPSARDVGSVIPACFSAYARLFLPVETAEGPLRWADVAARNGRIAHTEMQFHSISRAVGAPAPEGYDRGTGVSWGSLPVEEVWALVAVLARQSSLEADCWFCVWEGYGQLHGSPASGGLTSSGASQPVAGIVPPEVLAGPRVRLPQRDYLVLRGPLVSALTLLPELGGQSPNLWWPSDRSWCVATEIDFARTYVGGEPSLIANVLADPQLEALPAQTSDQFTYNSDLVNAALDDQNR